jgi:hypothetical protein
VGLRGLRRARNDVYGWLQRLYEVITDVDAQFKELTKT